MSVEQFHSKEKDQELKKILSLISRSICGLLKYRNLTFTEVLTSFSHTLALAFFSYLYCLFIIYFPHPQRTAVSVIY
jgi:hypothetical protein